MNSPSNTVASKISEFLIIIAWILFAISLVLPAGDYDIFNIGFGGKSHFPLPGFAILLFSIFASLMLTFAFPFFLLKVNSPEATAFIFISLAAYLIVAVMICRISSKSEKNSFSYKSRVLVIPAMLLLVFILFGQSPEIFLSEIRSGSPVIYIFPIMLVSWLICSLKSFQKRLYAHTTLVVFAPLIIALQYRTLYWTSRNEELDIVALFYVGYGFFMFLASLFRLPSHTKSNYRAWLLGNIATVHFLLFYVISNPQPAFVVWCMSLGCLAVGHWIKIQIKPVGISIDGSGY